MRLLDVKDGSCDPVTAFITLFLSIYVFEYLGSTEGFVYRTPHKHWYFQVIGGHQVVANKST
ncbi:MAG: hypothetical protein R2774_05370 [Saprospiraceae bacterium]